jgi:hypothetical protein
MRRLVTLQRGFAIVAATATATATVALSAGAALADTPISHTGTVGPHHLRDTQAKPGTKCRYEEGGGSGEEVLYDLVVKPPAVFAVDDTPLRDAQKVGWRAMIQRRNHGAASFTTIASTSTKKATAYEDMAAPFTSVDAPVTSHFGASFRVRITMFWYAADGTTVTGQATNEVDWYRKIAHSTSGTHNETLHNSCGDFYVE